jgi:hypothetical protein
MSRFAQGVYTVRNANKYVGKGQPRYRSSWELAMMNFLDNNEHIHQWASEAIQIPYRHPLTGKQSIYVPDFFIQYRTKNNTLQSEVVEIKPKSQSVVESKMNANQRATVAINYAKWDMATKWARRNGLTFRVINEDQIYRNGSR